MVKFSEWDTGGFTQEKIKRVEMCNKSIENHALTGIFLTHIDPMSVKMLPNTKLQNFKAFCCVGLVKELLLKISPNIFSFLSPK